MRTSTTRDIVLIVDDIEINRLILKSILSDDYDIIEASSGKEAYQALYKEDGHTPADVLPTIVLLDIMMPEIDGFQVLEKIKSNNATKNIPVLFITAADSAETESRGLLA